MKDLIDRRAAIKALEAKKDKSAKGDIGCFYNTIIQNDIDALKALPSVHPEIIRCKDCRYYEWMSNRVPDEQTWFCHNWNAETGKDDFCSYAERREE